MSQTVVREGSRWPRYALGVAVCLASGGLIGGVLYSLRGPDAEHQEAIERMREHARNGFRFRSPGAAKKAFEQCYRVETPQSWYADLLATAHRRQDMTRDGVACIRYMWDCKDGSDDTTVEVYVHGPTGLIWGVIVLEWAS